MLIDFWFDSEEAQRGKAYKCRGGIMAEEAVSLFKCFYEQGNPNGNHSHFYLQFCSLMKHLKSFCFWVLAPKPHRPVVQRERTWGERIVKTEVLRRLQLRQSDLKITLIVQFITPSFWDDQRMKPSIESRSHNLGFQKLI